MGAESIKSNADEPVSSYWILAGWAVPNVLKLNDPAGSLAAILVVCKAGPKSKSKMFAY